MWRPPGGGAWAHTQHAPSRRRTAGSSPKSVYYRKWGAAIARANAGLRSARLEFVGARGNRVREYAEDDGCGVAAPPPGALDGLVADVGGGMGGMFGVAAA